MKKILKRFGFKKKKKESAEFSGIDPRGITNATVIQLEGITRKISGGDVTVELALASIIHERAKARYFTTLFPVANNQA